MAVNDNFAFKGRVYVEIRALNLPQYINQLIVPNTNIIIFNKNYVNN